MIKTPREIERDVSEIRRPRILGDEISAAYTDDGILASPVLMPARCRKLFQILRRNLISYR